MPIMKIGTFFRLAAGLFVLGFAIQSEAATQEKGKETTITPTTGISRPDCIYCPPPSFPPEARKAKIESAKVVLEITISEKGRPSDIQVLSDPGHGFVREAVAAVKNWKFKPAVASDGRKIPTRVQIEVVSHSM